MYLNGRKSLLAAIFKAVWNQISSSHRCSFFCFFLIATNLQLSIWRASSKVVRFHFFSTRGKSRAGFSFIFVITHNCRFNFVSVLFHAYYQAIITYFSNHFHYHFPLIYIFIYLFVYFFISLFFTRPMRAVLCQRQIPFMCTNTCWLWLAFQ